MNADNAGQAPASGTAGQAPVNGAQQETGSAQQQSGTAAAQATFDAEYVKALRDEAAKHRTEKTAIEAELKKLRDAQLTDTERQANRLKELEAEATAFKLQRQELSLQMQIERQARKMGILDEDAAVKLLDRSMITFDDDGKPAGVEAALQQLTQQRPYMVNQAANGQNFSASNPARPQSSQTGMFCTAEQMRDPGFFNKNKDEIMRRVREQPDTIPHI